MSNEYRTVKSDIVAESEIMFDKYVNNINNLTFTYRMIHNLVKVGKKSKLFLTRLGKGEACFQGERKEKHTQSTRTTGKNGSK